MTANHQGEKVSEDLLSYSPSTWTMSGSHKPCLEQRPHVMLHWQFSAKSLDFPTKQSVSINALPVPVTSPPFLQYAQLTDHICGKHERNRSQTVRNKYSFYIDPSGSCLLSCSRILVSRAHTSSGEAITSKLCALLLQISVPCQFVCHPISNHRQDCSTVLGNPDFPANTYS